ncbi:PREDICTED: uncharacterized protein LOC105559114 [Vollenhovia emeryi]|uniref:uncharacterized protein LOC105559114 n=1 Tax=Vollenhovia emeryi TaxID=411798 RepID=UPI0005F4C03C|nr:PREDICTED: uncharacterized protein LOC105559114 [Vollenhovia emeryi]
MKPEQSNENRLDGTVMQQVSEHQNNMNMGMMDNMGLSMPMMMSSNAQQQITSVPMDSSGSSVQNVQPVAGPSTQAAHDQIAQNQTDAPTQQEDEDESSEEEENSDDECDGDEGLPIKEESEEDPNNSRTIEPTTFVNVSLACDEAGPSGLQQQKIADMPEMVMPQAADVDPKTGCNQLDPLSPTFLIVKLEDDYFRIPKSLSVFMMKEPPPEENNSKTESKEDEEAKEKNSRVEKAQNRVETRKRNRTVIDDLDDWDDLDDTPLDFRKRRKDELSKVRSSKHTTIPKKKSHICEICYITFDRKSKLTSHMFKHSNSRPHKCTICSKGFKTGAYLSRHMEIHDEPAQLHACTLCDFKARTKPYLKIHYIRKHTEDYNYSCEQCGKMFKVQSDYTTHMKDHDTESCVCDICGTSYPSKSSLYFHKHYKHKTKIKEFECQVCRKRFKTQKNLDSHAELHKMKYVCEQCGMEFKFKYGLTKHLRTHSGEKSYLCAICGKTFGCLSSQKIHLLTHVGERPYVCDICGQSFTQRSPMMLHRKKHPGVHPPPPPIKITNLLHGVQDKIVVNKSAKKSVPRDPLKQNFPVIQSKHQFYLMPMQGSYEFIDEDKNRIVDIPHLLDVKVEIVDESVEEPEEINKREILEIRDKKMDCRIFTDLVKLSRNVIKKNTMEDNNKLLGEVIFNDKFSSINETYTIEDVFYKKLANGDLHMRYLSDSIRVRNKNFKYQCKVEVTPTYPSGDECQFVQEQNCSKKILQTDASGCFIVGKDSIPMRLWQHADAGGKLRYSLIPILDDVKAEEVKVVPNVLPLTSIKAEKTEARRSNRRISGSNVGSCRDFSMRLGNQVIDSYTCNRCNMKFPMQSMLNRHKVTHDMRLWLRRKCLREKYTRYLKINTRRQLKMQKRLQQTKYVCTLCDFNCNRLATLDAHLKRKHLAKTNPKKLSCTICSYECSSKVNLSRHMSKHRNKNTTSLACNMCDFECKRSTTLASHLESHKRSKKTSDASCAKRTIMKCSYTSPKKTSQSDCSHSRGTALISYQDSNLIIKKEVYAEDRSETSAIAADAPKKSSQKRPLVEEHCDLCDFTCAKKSTLYSHKRRHKVEDVNEVYACNECGFKTAKKSSLYSHIKRKHKEPRSSDGDAQPELFYCSQCDFKNKNKYELKIHVARKHTDDFKFSCETCGKKFKVKGDLTNHIRFSHREQPVICDVCGKICLNSNSLYVHQKFAHYKAKYECQICKRRMVSQENLNEHMLRQHERKENVVCEECGKTFSRNSRLKVHMRIHTGDKPYSCTICKKSFARRTALKQHLLIHTGIRPYVCDICGKAFTQKPGLISHRKSHPGSHPPLPRVLIDHILNDFMNG